LKTWPAIDVEPGAQIDLLLAEVDDFHPTAIEEVENRLRIFFTAPADRDRAAHALQEKFHASPVNVGDDDWARRSQENLTPITVGRIVVAPPWHHPATDHQPEAASHEPLITLVIAPSMGFGTGHHATTRLCLAALQQIDVAAAEVLDFGTGSGVLAMAAVHLGAAHALGVDDDPDAIQSAVESLALNPDLPAGRIVFVVGDLMTMEVPAADVVTANLTGGLLIRASGRLRQAVKPGGLLIMSGLETTERDQVWRAFDGFEQLSEAEEAGWSTITARRLSKLDRVSG
jgi:ribosomal protein L11 methyltransferase